MDKARNLLHELDFKDRELQDFSSLQNSRDMIQAKYFDQSRAEVINQRKTSAYKRKYTMNSVSSEVSNYITAPMPVGITRAKNTVSKMEKYLGRSMQSVISEVSENNDTKK